MDPFFGWTAAALTAYLAGCDSFEDATTTSDGLEVPNQDVSEHGSDVSPSSTYAQPFAQSTYSVLASPPLPGRFPASPRSPLKRRARHQHGFPKRRKVSTEACKPIVPSTGFRKKRRGNSSESSPEVLEARLKIQLPRRALSTPSTPVSSSETSPSTPPSSIDDSGPDIQIAQPSTLGSATPPSSVGVTTPTTGKLLSLVADNIVIGSKRPAPAEFNEEVNMPHRKKYITGWMSEYIRLRAHSWREMLRVMQKARWRPFRPQVIPYLAPAPPSAPLPTSHYMCANPTPITGDLPVETASPAHRAESPSPSSRPPSPDDSLHFLAATTTPPYSPPESPFPFTPSSPHPEVEVVTPPDTPTPPSASGVAYSLVPSGQGCIDSLPSTPKIPWADKGKWRADATPEQVAYRPGSIATTDPTPMATDLRLPIPLLLPTISSLSPPEVPLSSTTPTTPYYPLHLPTLRTGRPRPVSNAKQSRVCQKGFRRIKSTRFEPTKLAHLRLRSQVKWHFQESRWWKRLAERPNPQMRNHLPHPPTHHLPPPPPAPVSLPVLQRTGFPRTGAHTPKRLKAIKQCRRLKATRPKPFKMRSLRLRSEVKWRLKDLGIEKRPPLPPPPPPVVPTQPTQVHPVLVLVGLLPAWLWPAGVFYPPPPGPVIPTPQQAGWGAGSRISVSTSDDPPKRAYRPRRRRRLIPDDSVPMEGVE